MNGVIAVDIEKVLSQMTAQEKDNKRKGAQLLKRILESNSLHFMTMSSGGTMPYPVAKGFEKLTNRHYLRGIKWLLTMIKVPDLPKTTKR